MDNALDNQPYWICPRHAHHWYSDFGEMQISDEEAKRRNKEFLLAAHEADKQAAVNPVYRERNQLVAYLAKQYPSYIAIDPAEPDWPVVYIDGPTGQMSWHIGANDLDLFTGLNRVDATDKWDGHTTEEKYQRLASIRKGKE